MVYQAAGRTDAELCDKLIPARAAVADPNRKPYGRRLDTSSDPKSSYTTCSEG
jgi:hypothetical protein